MSTDIDRCLSIASLTSKSQRTSILHEPISGLLTFSCTAEFSGLDSVGSVESLG